MNSTPRLHLLRLLIRSVAVVVSIGLCFGIGLILCQQLWGGWRITRTGEAYGFRIGMSKRELFQRYRELGESTHLRSFDGEGQVTYLSVDGRGQWQMSPSFMSGDRWMGYRARYPVWFQEFEFEDGRLVQIGTYIRFYETP
ncbi:MAG: hypothetical protein JNN07_22570 [Verrucomicrobiales bacterium]|nr:hypothetical protein [Verrucomicrobiales bacterium]